MYTIEELEKMTVKELLEIAKSEGIKGRHEMKRAKLIISIIAQNIKAHEKEKNVVEEVAAEETKRTFGDVVKEEKKKTLLNSFEDELTAIKNKVVTWEDSGVCTQLSGVRTRQSYLEAAQIGNLVAFKVNDKKMLSGKIISILDDRFVIETKNGLKFSVLKRAVVWVKLNNIDRWPRGVYLALKGEAGVDEYKRPY